MSKNNLNLKKSQKSELFSTNSFFQIRQFLKLFSCNKYSTRAFQSTPFQNPGWGGLSVTAEDGQKSLCLILDDYFGFKKSSYFKIFFSFSFNAYLKPQLFVYRATKYQSTELETWQISYICRRLLRKFPLFCFIG